MNLRIAYCDVHARAHTHAYVRVHKYNNETMCRAPIAHVPFSRYVINSDYVHYSNPAFLPPHSLTDRRCASARSFPPPLRRARKLCAPSISGGTKYKLFFLPRTTFHLRRPATVSRDLSRRNGRAATRAASAASTTP